MPLLLHIDQIMAALTLPEGSPRAAIEAAQSRRLEVTRRVLAAVDDWLATLSIDDRIDTPTPLLIGVHLLAEWRVTALYRPLLRALRLTQDEVEAQFSDAVTESMGRVVAAVCDGDPAPILAAVADPAVGEYAAHALCEALLVLLVEGAVDAGPVEAFVRAQFAERPRRADEDGLAWVGLADLVAALRIADLKPRVLLAHRDGRIDPTFQSYADFESDWAAWAGGLAAPPADRADALKPWTGTADYFESWQWGEADGLDAPPAADSRVDLYRGVGRNDPCPCGSGRKFKKCCLPRLETEGAES